MILALSRGATAVFVKQEATPAQRKILAPPVTWFLCCLLVLLLLPLLLLLLLLGEADEAVAIGTEESLERARALRDGHRRLGILC